MLGRGLFQSRRRRNQASPSAQPLPVRDNNGVTSSYATEDTPSSSQQMNEPPVDPILGPEVSDPDVSSMMNDDSIFFGTQNMTTDFSSPKQMDATDALSLIDSPTESNIFTDAGPPHDMTETDIQTVTTENVFSTIGMGGLSVGGTQQQPRRYAQLDVENAVHRILHMSSDDNNDSADYANEDVVSPASTKVTMSASEPPTPTGPSTSSFGEWVRESPFWLKLMFAGSLFFLSVAFVLVVIGIFVATKTQQQGGWNSATTTNSNNPWWNDDIGDEDVVFIPPEDISFPIVPRPTGPPVPKVAANPPTTPGAPVVVVVPTPAPQQNSVPVSVVATKPTEPPTLVPTIAPQPLETNIYITAGILPNTEPVRNLLNLLPGTAENSFLVHLGDWNNATQQNVTCDASVYQETAVFYRQSSVPVYFVLGDNGKLQSASLHVAPILMQRVVASQNTMTAQIHLLESSTGKTTFSTTTNTGPILLGRSHARAISVTNTRTTPKTLSLSTTALSFSPSISSAALSTTPTSSPPALRPISPGSNSRTRTITNRSIRS